MVSRQVRRINLLGFFLSAGGVVAAACLSVAFAAWYAYPPGPDWAGEGEKLAAASCVGPADASTLVVYLHGYDVDEVSSQERRNRRVLSALAGHLGVRIAFPRARNYRDTENRVLSWTAVGLESDNTEQLALQWRQIFD